jgi:hypothetical protein
MPHIQPAEKRRNNSDVTRHTANSDFASDAIFERCITRLHRYGPRPVGEFIRVLVQRSIDGALVGQALTDWLATLERSGGERFVIEQGLNQYAPRLPVLVPREMP